MELPATEWDSSGGLLLNLIGGVPKEGHEVEFQVLSLRVEGGGVVSAANVENASYGLTICAERAAVVAAVAAGHRSFEAVAVAADGPEPASACGACRQVLREFPPGPALRVLLAGESGDQLVVTTLEELLPGGFGPERLRHGPGWRP